ncbi:MAG: [LysW]-lysine hydrolase [Chloroflexi bacterium]|nr:[LysW]-lysine hydrolase [Chloroflexota bacterium]
MDDRSFLEGLIRRPSPSGHEDEVAACLLATLGGRGLRVGRDTVGNAWAEAGPERAERCIVLLGHMDTVAGDVPVRWEGDLLYGRGAVDAKGPLAAFAMATLAAAPRLARTRVRVVGAVEEERESRGAHFLATQPPPHCCIIGEPSGWQGITLGYKGVLRLDYRHSQPSSHSAGQDPSAAEVAVAFWNEVAAFARAWSREKGPFRALDVNLRTIQTGSDGLADWVQLAASLRLPPEMEPEALRAHLRVWANGAQVEFPYAEPPIETPKTSLLARLFLRAIRAQGEQPRFKLKTGTSDMNVVGPAWGCPIVAYGPGDSSLDHSPHEHISFSEFRRAVAVLTQVLEALDAAA